MHKSPKEIEIQRYANKLGSKGHVAMMQARACACACPYSHASPFVSQA